jgi:hypothetical protein
MPTQAKPMDKKSYKEEFLEMVRKKAGLLTTIRMEEALKNDAKNQKDAQIGQGLTTENIAQTQNFDLSGILPNEPKIKEPNLNELLTTNTAPPTPLPQTKPQTQFTPAKGLFSPAQQLPTGQIQEGGALSWITRNSTGDLLKRLLVKAKIEGGENENFERQESFRLNNELKRLQIEAINQTGEVPKSEDLLAGIPEDEVDDYLIKPVKQTIRGMVNTVPILERKKTLPAKQLEDLGAFENTQQDLSAVVERLKSSGLQLGPGFSTRPGAISDMLGQMKGPEFAALKSDIGRNFQTYRKWVTGVAAGYPELNMLAPNYPKATDANDIFIQKSVDVMKDIERNREIMLDHFSKGGYAVSKLRKKTSQVPEVGQMFNGAKVLNVERID